MALNLPSSLRLVGGALLMLLASAAPAWSETLNLLIWEAYISPKVIERWTASTHTDINQIYFDSGDKRDSMLFNPGASIDLAIIEQARIGPLGERGMLTELPRRALPDLHGITPQWRDACGRYGAAYLWGLDGILYRADKVASPPTSWPDLLQPAASLRQHVAMLKDDDDILAAPLSFLGKPNNTDNIDDLRKAFSLLQAQAPSVLTYDYVTTAEQEARFAGRIYMALGYTGDQTALNRDAAAGNNWHFVIPREGSVIWVDCLAVIHKSQHRDLALQFIDFINRPENAAENATYLKMPTPNTAAISLLPEAMRDDPEIYPPADVVARSQLRGLVPATTLQLRRRIVSALVGFNDAQ